jgi:hypothetical protein
MTKRQPLLLLLTLCTAIHGCHAQVNVGSCRAAECVRNPICSPELVQQVAAPDYLPASEVWLAGSIVSATAGCSDANGEALAALTAQGLPGDFGGAVVTCSFLPWDIVRDTTGSLEVSGARIGLQSF